MNGVVLLLAAGAGVRLGCGPKGFVELAGIPLVRRAAEAACAAEEVTGLVCVVPSGLEAPCRDLLGGLPKPLEVVAGGETRQGSAARGLEAAGEASAVAVHDAARALCRPELFDRCLGALDGADAAIAACPVSDTIKEASDGLVRGTLDRDRLVAVQTPQAFRADVYRRAHDTARTDGVLATDDAALVERLGVAVRLVEGDERNLKITTSTDLRMAEALLDGR